MLMFMLLFMMCVNVCLCRNRVLLWNWNVMCWIWLVFMCWCWIVIISWLVLVVWFWMVVLVVWLCWLVIVVMGLVRFCQGYWLRLGVGLVWLNCICMFSCLFVIFMFVRVFCWKVRCLRRLVLVISRCVVGWVWLV